MNGIIERAIQLAKSGDYYELRHIEAKLRKEGYADTGEYLNGKLIRQQLRDFMRAARNP